jgi:rhodanese-related sulfurtransferase
MKTMNARHVITIILLLLGGLLAVMPYPGKFSLNARPDQLLAESLDENSSFTADQVARFVVTEDSTIQLIDLRRPAEYRQFNIPGSISLPYEAFLESDPDPFLNKSGIRNVFYSNGDRNAAYALILARGLGYKNCFVLKGGLNAWYDSIMNSKFAGVSISARENALFETRMKAKRLFLEVNSMPDSMKHKYIASKRFDPKKLDGGCE